MYTAIIIDDEKWVIKSLRAILQNQTYFSIIGEAYNGPQGLKLVLEKNPDLAFVDVKMPGMGGLELISAANLEHVNTQFCLISGHAEFAYVQKALAQKAIGYCLKPFSPNEINDSLKRAYEKIQLLETAKQVHQEKEEDNAEYNIPTDHRIVKAMATYIHNHYNENISIQQISAHCNINPNYASQLFNQKMGVSYSSYLTDIRIKKALTLLENTDLTVSEIAVEVGYRDYFYFAKVFKKAKGITPTSYRKNQEGFHE